MKKMKKIMAAAIAMMTFSTAAAVTGTVAWFTANNIVSASGMTVQAEAEEGIVIAKQKLTSYVDADWGQSVTALYSGAGTKYIPTSTSDAATWYHGNATNVDEYADTGDGAVATISDIAVSDGIGASHTLGDKNVYLLNKFYIQSAVRSDTGLTNQDLFVKSITVTENSTNSPLLNKSLRVLFKTADATIIYAPLATNATVAHDGGNVDGKGGLIGGTTNIIVNKSVTLDDQSKFAYAAYDKLFDDETIPGYVTAGPGLEINVYIYFEGEDFNCKSANIVPNLDTLAVEFKFENKAHA